MADLRRGDRLAMEPLDHRRGAQLRVQDLDRDALVEPDMRAQVHRAHPSGREQELDPVLVVEHRAAREGSGTRSTFHDENISHEAREFTPGLQLAARATRDSLELADA